MLPIPTENGFQRFREAILTTLKPTIEKIYNEHRDEYILVTWNLANNIKGPRRVNRVLDSREKALTKVWGGFLEIERSYRTLNEIPIYLKRFPPNSPSKAQYLELIITSYLNEVYVFKNRIDSYTKKIARLYKNELQLGGSRLLIQLGHELIKSFDKIIKIRGGHVHEHRYNDDDLDSLAYLEIFIDDKELAQIGITKMYRKLLKFNKMKWLQTFQNNKNTFQIVLDAYFAGLHSIIFDEKGNFLVPK